MIERVTGLFGTVTNAHRQLGLEGLVPYSAFYRGMHFHTITPQHYILIDNAWRRWQEVFLRPEVPVSDPLVLTVEYKDAEPSWWPSRQGNKSRGPAVTTMTRTKKAMSKKRTA